MLVPDEIERLRLMVESHTDQVEILRAFPDHSWESIQDIYSYNCTPNRRWFTDYAGKRPYPQRTCWQDTLEYKLLNISPESSASYTPIGFREAVFPCTLDTAPFRRKYHPGGARIFA